MTPRGMWAPRRRKRSGAREELDHLGQLELRLVAARHVVQVDRPGVAGVDRRRSSRIVGGRGQDRPEPARGVTVGRTGPVHAQDEERQHGQQREGNDQADDGADRVDGGRDGLTGHDDDVAAGACVLLERIERRVVEGDLTGGGRGVSRTRQRNRDDDGNEGRARDRNRDDRPSAAGTSGTGEAQDAGGRTHGQLPGMRAG